MARGDDRTNSLVKCYCPRVAGQMLATASPRMRLDADAVVDKAPAARSTNRVSRSVSLRRFVAAIWRSFVEASAFETEEGLVIARGWYCPWLCFPVTPPSLGRGGRGPCDRRGSS
jgi:hypothetical protein